MAMTMNETRVFVTGGTGMIGSHLVRSLRKEGYLVWVLTRLGSGRIRLRDIEDVQFIETDLLDREALDQAFQRVRPHVVFHLASTLWAQGPRLEPMDHLRANAMGTMTLLEVLCGYPHTKVVVTGSSSVYGSGSHLREDRMLAPTSVYGATKAAASLLMQTYARAYGLRTVELRLFMPYGPGELPIRLVPHTILSALAGQDVPMTLGTQQRDLIYIDDVVDALMLAAATDLAPGTVINIGSGAGVPVRQVVETILELMGHPVKALLGAVPMRPDELMECSADITAARQQLGWQPRVSLRQGLERTIAWLKEHHDIVGVAA